MRLALTAPHTVHVLFMGPVGACGWHADATVSFEPMRASGGPHRANAGSSQSTGMTFVNGLGADEDDPLPAEYITAFAHGILLGLAGRREVVRVTRRPDGRPHARFEPDAINLASVPVGPVVAPGDELRVVLRASRWHPTDANDLAYRRAGWLAVLAAADGVSEVRYRG